jgi:hypothetical protein
MSKLENLIDSNVSLFSQIVADIETLKLIVEKNVKYNKEFLLDELSYFKERTMHILDIEYDDKIMYTMIDKLIVLFNTESTNEQKNTELTKLHDFILSIIFVIVAIIIYIIVIKT